jgi:hypothetical protein
MVENIGYANLFRQADLITETSSKFTAFSGASGSSLFSLQLFFSQPFFEKVVFGDQGTVANLILVWMTSYTDFLRSTARGSFLCPLAAPLRYLSSDLDDIVSVCRFGTSFQDSYATFTTGMMRATSTAYGDPGLVDRSLSTDNRLPAFARTDYHTGFAIAPNSRFVESNPIGFLGLGIFRTRNDTTTFLRPAGGVDLYAVPLHAHYILKTDGSRHFRLNVKNSSLPLQTEWTQSPPTFSFKNYAGFHLFRENVTSNINMLFADTRLTRVQGSGAFNPLFGGKTPTVGQMLGPTFAGSGGLSGGTPSLLAQLLSHLRYVSTQSSSFLSRIRGQIYIKLLAYNTYTLPMARNLGVCSQWPNSCGPNDSRLIDGGYTEGPGKFERPITHTSSCCSFTFFTPTMDLHSYYCGQDSHLALPNTSAMEIST